MLWAIIDWNFGVKYFGIYYGISLNKHPKMFGWNWPNLFSFSPFAWGEIWHFIRVFDYLVEIDKIWPVSKQQKWLSFTQWWILSFIQWCFLSSLVEIGTMALKKRQRDNEHLQQCVLRKAHRNHWIKWSKEQNINMVLNWMNTTTHL